MDWMVVRGLMRLVRRGMLGLFSGLGLELSAFHQLFFLKNQSVKSLSYPPHLAPKLRSPSPQFYQQINIQLNPLSHQILRSQNQRPHSQQFQFPMRPGYTAILI